MAPVMPYLPSVSTSRAPNAFNRTLRSVDMVSGMVSTRRYPLHAATYARPTPVFPEVGSTRMVRSGEMRPSASARSIIASAILSLTLRQIEEDSSLATISPKHRSVTLFKRMRGVLPMVSSELSFNSFEKSAGAGRAAARTDPRRYRCAWRVCVAREP